MVVCRECGAQNADAHRFCASCGTGLAATCPSCRNPVVEGQRFCAMCGHALGVAGGSDGPLPPPMAPAAERRVCSVLFADLVGFTPLSEARDPEEVRELLSEYFEATRTVITRYGGVVEKFIGDAVMAVWGTPVATEGDAERAVRAALEVVAAVAELGAAAGVAGLQARAGVVTGEVAVTLGATTQGMVAGDAVNTAARVQAAAEPGSVLVDGATQRLSAAAIGFTEAGEHLLKGKSEAVVLWRATRVLAGVGGSQRVDGLEGPFTGRDAELRTVKELMHAGVERRTPRLVFVTGPAGVGKSRLGWEFEKYVDGLVESVLWHRGRCLSYGEGVAFWALAEIVRQRFDIAEEDAAEVASAKLADRLGSFVPDPTERAYVGPRLGRLLGVPYPGAVDAPLSREELFAGWRLFFERLADADPVILLIEDAQHADRALLDFVDHLIDWARTSPIYVLVFARSGPEDQRPGWATGRNRTVLTLDPLDARSMDALVEALVPGMPAVAVASIAAQAQGNPLFAVETVRSLIDRDAIVPIEGVYRLVGDVGELSVPDSLHALLAARLDALDPTLRSLVADAAVLGSSFPAEALVAVSGRESADVEAALAELLRREVLEISADRLSPQRGAYHFSQNLLRQVAYETLSRRDRKARHLAVAAHLRATFAAGGDEVSEVVAQHYLDAIEAVPDDTDAAELRERAIAALIRSGERSAESGAPARAAETFARAAALTEESDRSGGATGTSTDAAHLWDRAAAAGVLGLLFEEALAWADRSAAIYGRAGDLRAQARAQDSASRALRRLGRLTDARARIEPAVEVLRERPDRDTVRVLAELATVATFSGGSDALPLASEALALGQAVGVGDGGLADLFTGRGRAAGFHDRFAEAAADLEYAARLAERAGDTLGWVRAGLNLASITLATNPRESRATSHIAVERARQLGDRYFLPVAIANEAVALLLLGEWDEADRVLRHGMEVDQLDTDALASAYLGSYSVILPALRGDLATAEVASNSPAMLAMAGSEDPQDRSSVEVAAALVAVAAGQPREALGHAREALSHEPALGIAHECVLWAWPTAARTAYDLGDRLAVQELLAQLDAHPVGHVPPLLGAEATLARARLLGAVDDPAAEEAFAEAIAALRQFGSPFHLAHALLDHAEHLSRTDAGGVAASLVEEARGLGEQLRSRLIVDRSSALSADRMSVQA